MEEINGKVYSTWLKEELDCGCHFRLKVYGDVPRQTFERRCKHGDFYDVEVRCVKIFDGGGIVTRTELTHDPKKYLQPKADREETEIYREIWRKEREQA